MALMFPTLNEVNCVQPLLKLCLDSLVQHSSYLLSVLPLSHGLRATHIFREPMVLQALSNRLVTGASQWMRPTGIPPHVALLRNQKATLDAVNKLSARLLEGMAKFLEEKSIGAGNITQ
ncbi:TPA: hypothetical protein N0F65_002937 [Lagenidium giganteum]|uniref:Uncharacterized protein n=1 Tax=Lagenidium giganteum TaxID=4803 RepID=A0AAV2Z665_9STRA|nr:TPA: hypothetical protein N0F65_002937 [Lagenidium giganteum]